MSWHFVVVAVSDPSGVGIQAGDSIAVDCSGTALDGVVLGRVSVAGARSIDTQDVMGAWEGVVGRFTSAETGFKS